jgi:hypothetical protein
MKNETKNNRRKMREKSLKLYGSGNWRKTAQANRLMKKATKNGNFLRFG